MTFTISKGFHELSLCNLEQTYILERLQLQVLKKTHECTSGVILEFSSAVTPIATTTDQWLATQHYGDSAALLSMSALQLFPLILPSIMRSKKAATKSPKYMSAPISSPIPSAGNNKALKRDIFPQSVQANFSVWPYQNRLWRVITMSSEENHKNPLDDSRKRFANWLW